MILRAFTLAIALCAAACSEPPPATTAETPAIAPPPDIPTDMSSDGFAEAMDRGEGVWFRRSGSCPITIEFLPATDGTLVRREAQGNDPASMRLSVEPNAARIDDAREMRWPGADGESRFVWQDEYATLLIGDHRCEYSRGLVRGPRPTTLP